MAEKKINATGSLSRRVLLIALSLLVIPLFFHSLFLYRTEYQEKLSDIQLTLKVIGEGQIALLQERIHLEWTRLDAVQNETGPIAKKLGIEAMSLPSGSEGHFALVSFNNLIVGRQVSDQKALIILTPFDELIAQLTHFQDAPYPVSVAFTDKEGKTLGGKVEPEALSVKLPVSEGNFSLLLTVPISAIEELHFQNYLYRFLILLFFIGGVGGVIVWLITKRVAKPLRHLCSTMGRVSEGAAHVRYQPDRMGFEINELGKQFNTTLDSLLQHREQAEQERLGRERLAQELKIGREIQMSLLPTHLPHWKELDIAPAFFPAMEVSGDFYDLFPIQGNKLLIVIADTASKGISACLYALGFRSLLRSFASMKQQLSDALFEANHLFWLDAKQSSTFITAWVGIYDREKGTLTYSNFGHPPPILKREGHLQELTTSGIALGALESDTIITKTISLQKGDLLFLYTDGILEAHNLRSERFGQRRLQDLLTTDLPPSSQQIVERLVSAVQAFSCQAGQHDDMTCLAIRILEN